MRRYDILDVQAWPHVACGPAFMFAMDAFLIMTGLLAARRLIPSWTAAKRSSRQELKTAQVLLILHLGKG